MSRPRAFITREIFPDALEMIRAEVDAEVWPGRASPAPGGPSRKVEGRGRHPLPPHRQDRRRFHGRGWAATQGHQPAGRRIRQYLHPLRHEARHSRREHAGGADAHDRRRPRGRCCWLQPVASARANEPCAGATGARGTPYTTSARMSMARRSASSAWGASGSRSQGALSAST